MIITKDRINKLKKYCTCDVSRLTAEQKAFCVKFLQEMFWYILHSEPISRSRYWQHAIDRSVEDFDDEALIRLFSFYQEYASLFDFLVEELV